ncbi:MAG: FimV/HubP family polar landmark protein, partial [Wenzhouxiangella sp.]
MSNATAKIGGPAALAAMLLLCQTALAGLGLGEARVESFLGQELDVRIALLQSGDTDLDSLEVSVASAEDYARLGVPSEALALGLSAALDLSAEAPMIRLRSERAVAEPFVQVLINARWASGRLLREYTLLIDPPSVPVAPPVRRAEEQAAPAPDPAPEDADAAAQPRAQARPSPTPAQTESQASDPAASAVLVERGDTLWSIAAAWRPDDGLTMEQAILAIFERNPDAFMDNNVNRLRRGARLALPRADAARAIPAAEAERRFREQNQAWQAGRAIPAADVPAPIEEAVAEPVEPIEPIEPDPAVAGPDAEAPEPEAVGAETAEDAPAEESAAVASEEQAPAEPAPLARLELAPADEDLAAEAAASDAERQRLGERLAELESEMALDGLQSPQTDALVDQIRQAIDSADSGGLMVASEDLATLEAQLREAREARAAEQRAAQPAPTPVEPPEAAAPGPLATAPASFGERWMWPLIGALFGLGLLGVLVVMLRRRAAARDQVVTEAEPRAAAAPAAAGGVDADAAAFGVEPEPVRSDRAKEEEAAQAAALMGILGREDEEEAPAEAPPATRRADRSPNRAEPDQDEDAPDLARLSDRLDPEERAETSSTLTSEETLALEDEDIENLFEADEQAADTDRLAEADPGPLTLDFDLPEQDLDTAEGRSTEEREPEATDAPGVSGAPEQSGQAAAGPPPDEDLALDEDRFEPVSVIAPPAPDSDEPDWFALDEAEEVSDALDPATPAGSGDEPAWPVTEAPSEDVAETPALGDEDAEVKLDLARAYLSMEDPDSARTLLEEVLSDGSPAHQEQ